MMFRKNMRLTTAVTILGILGIVGNISARENVATSHRKSELKTTAGCQPATAEIDMDINNVRAHLMTGGDMWWNRGSGIAAYEIPKGSNKSSQFAASCWIGGYDKQGQLKVAAQTYRQNGNDYWPGALDVNGKITAEVCNNWDRFWKIDRATINSFIELSKTGGNTSTSTFDVINQWPATGNSKAIGNNGTALYLNPNNSYAPFADLNGNGIYEPNKGEYPEINGDQYIWWVFNDAGNVKGESITAAMGVEVQTSAFAYATQDFLNNATFCNYRVINRGPLTIDSTYIAVWDDADLGYYLDDYIGCDTTRGLGILYNGTNDDGGAAGHPTNSYGLNPPQVALDFFQGPKRVVNRPGLPDTVEQLGMTNFTYFNNDASIIGNPTNGTQIYGYMTGSIRNGQRFSNDFQGPGIPSKGYGSGVQSNFVFWGDPGDNTQWSECACNNNPGDRRFIFSSGPFQLLAGAVNDITFGCVWAASVGGCGAATFKTIKNIDDGAQALFDSRFKTVEGPEAPRLVVRELDRKLVFYIVNDYGSNNYGENYGRSDGPYNDSLRYHQIAIKAKGVSDDSLYKFQGYRVFQLANSQVTSADIFDPNTGEVDNTKAYEVFQCDVRDGVTQIVNYVKNTNVSDTTNNAQIKIIGKDSGIVHSFELTNDQFATGSDKTFINYHNYYFVAIAYAYNNFASFNPRFSVSTQDQPYLGSAHGAGGTNVKTIVALPNPANGDMGTVINAEYGSGVSITRVEGMGNGGNVIQLDSLSELTAVTNGKVDNATYLIGQGPINVKVIDPIKVPTYDWVLQIIGNYDTVSGMDSASTWKLTAMENGVPKDTIYSEKTILTVNEQIIEKYGISIQINQVKAPGLEPALGNGYLTSDVTFANSAKSWLWGVQDQADSSFANWLRSGNNQQYTKPLNATLNPCNFNDYSKLDINSNYQNLLSNFSPTKSTWGPYALAAAYTSLHSGTGTQCGFQIAYTSVQTQDLARFRLLPDVDLVFTSDKSKWTRCAVIEQQEDPALAEGYTGKPLSKFYIRQHRGWNLDIVGNNTPVYSEVDSELGLSWFPGYAVDQNTGQRLNIVFGEDSYLSGDNGNDMIWNPSSGQSSYLNGFNPYDGSIIFGGKHVVYVLGSKYDSAKAFTKNVKSGLANNLRTAYSQVRWVGIPLVNPTVPLLSLSEGLIPTETKLRFRVKRPYAAYAAVDTTAVTPVAPVTGKASTPYYTFSTRDQAPTALSDTSDRNKLLNRIFVVPNPYYGYSGYENNRFSTKVRIINLPAKVTVYIYSLDGSLVRTLTKNDPNTSYLDWDIRNTVGLPIASGMYMMHVKAEGIGETVLRWFGATRPIDVTQY